MTLRQGPCWEMESIRGPLQCCVCIDLSHKKGFEWSLLFGSHQPKMKKRLRKVETLECDCMTVEE